MDRLDSEKQLKELIDGIPGGIGIFDVFYDDTMALIYLNDGYYQMIGSSREERQKYYGSSVLEVIPVEVREQMWQKIHKAIDGDGRFTLTMPNQGLVGQKKWLQLDGKIVERTPEKCVFYVTYSDVTDYERTMQELERTRAEIQIATDKVGILYWIYDAAKHQTVITSGKGYGYGTVIDHVPECFRGTGDVLPEDEYLYFGLYDQMQAGADSCECYVRIFNHKLNLYQWQHIAYTKLSENRYVGSSVDVTEQKRAEQQYYDEIALRRELLSDSVFSYQINLTRKIVEEKTTKLPQSGGRKAPFPLDDNSWNWARKLFVASDEWENFDSRFRADHLLEAWNRGETTVSVQAYRLRLNGRIHWFKSTCSMMKRPESGDIIAVTYTSNIDETRNNKLAIERAFSEEMEFIALLDVEKETIRLVSGRTGESIVPPEQETLFSVYHDDAIKSYVLDEDRRAFEENYTVARMKEHLKEESVYLFTYRCRTETGEVRRKKLRMFYLDEFHQYIIVARRDITDLYNEELRQEAVLKSALQEAEGANRAKSTFLSRMSHDIRTPMNAIIGMTGLAEEEDDLAQIRDYLGKIDSAGNYLLSLLNDILDMSKIESGKFEIHKKPDSVHKVFAMVQSVFEPQCSEKGIRFVCQIMPDHNWVVLMDSLRLNQVIMNLLSNALKYTGRGGEIGLYVERGEVTDGSADVKIIVRDDGCGMSDEFQKHMFEAFTQEKSGYTETTAGTGLGLAIVKNLVELMGGTISVKSRQGEGTEYTIRFRSICITDQDALKKLHEENQESPVDDRLLEGCRVLLAEDHPLNAEIARKLLEKKQMKVDLAQNGQIAVDMFREAEPGTYGVILMDIRMPVMDGLTATRLIRTLNREDAQKIPIIAMTANAFDEDVKESLDSGMTDYLSKPIDVKRLYQTLDRCLGKDERSCGTAAAGTKDSGGSHNG